MKLEIYKFCSHHMKKIIMYLKNDILRFNKLYLMIKYI